VSSIAYQPMRDFATEWDNGYPSAVFSGIVALSGGYHASIEDSVWGSYSVVRVDDKAPPGTWPRNLSAAIDMSKNTSDMVKEFWRVWRVFSNPADPRRAFFNAYDGWDGSGDAVRLDFVTGGQSWANSTHKWHGHLEWRRRHVTNPISYVAARSMLLTDEGIPAYLARIGAAPAPTPTGNVPGTRTLRVIDGAGMLHGEDVLFVQKYIGWRCGTPDGWYGNGTANGVRWYQGMRGIQVDGEVGPVTWTHLLQRAVTY